VNNMADRFQSDFIRAIYGHENEAETLAQLTSQPGFKVYRNTVLKACADALAANYPSVVQLVGTDWFRSAALIHAHAEPPQSVCLIEYGQRFADFLSDFVPAAELTYLADVARLDRCWTECHIAADSPALQAAQLAALSPEALLQSVLRMRAAVRWHWCSAQPAYTIWDANRRQSELAQELNWRGEGALLSRIDGAVIWQPASLGMCVFLDACAQGADLQTASGRAFEAEPGIDVAALLGTLLAAQVFAL